MTNPTINKTHLVLINAIIEKDGKILISRRSYEEVHEPGKWTVPGGKVEKTHGNVWNILQKTLKKEVMEETCIKIDDHVELFLNNTFIHSTGQHVVVLVFLCHWKSGDALPREDTIEVKWITEKELKKIKFPPNVKKYIQKGFQILKKK